MIDDLISRQAAIDEFYSRADDDGYVCYSAEDMEGIIRTLPSAQPERTGKWIQISPAKIYECSKCGKNVMTDDIDAYHWCHGCGARMEE